MKNIRIDDFAKAGSADTDMTYTDRLDRLLETFVEEGIPGCALAVVYQGKVVYTGYRGFARIEEGRQISEDTVYKLASCTKTMTSTAIMRLFEDGIILLDDPVEKYLPFFKDLTWQSYDGSGELVVHPVSGPVTIRHLLTMTSGIPYMGKGSVTAQAYMKEIGGMYDLPVMELARKIARIPLQFDPGTHWQYGFSYDVLAAVAEAVTGKTFSQYLKESVLDPLGMDRTSFVVSEDLEKDLAGIYRFTDGKAVGISAPVTEAEKKRMAGGFGGGGLVSTLGDLTKFIGMWSQGGIWEGTRILGSRTIELMRKNHLAGQPYEDFRLMAKQSYPWYKGYSWSLAGRTCVDPAEAGSNGNTGEFGWCGAVGPYLLADPQARLGVAYAQQTAPVIGGKQDYTHPRIRNAVYAILDELWT